MHRALITPLLSLLPWIQPAGGREPVGPAATGAGPAATQDPKPWDPKLGTATIRGVARFTGVKVPKRRPVDMGSDPKCHEAHAEPLLDESAIVNDDGTLRNAFVYVKKGLEGWRFEPPATARVLDQKGCVYAPHVAGIQVGQMLEVRNDDPVVHNVHTFSQKNDAFNQSQAAGSPAIEKQFQKPEVMIQVKCDIHGWMSSYLGVVEHPFFAVTGEGGTFALAGLPPGEYEVVAWHEMFGTSKADLSVADGATAEIEFSFSKKPGR